MSPVVVVSEGVKGVAKPAIGIIEQQVPDTRGAIVGRHPNHARVEPALPRLLIGEGQAGVAGQYHLGPGSGKADFLHRPGSRSEHKIGDAGGRPVQHGHCLARIPESQLEWQSV